MEMRKILLFLMSILGSCLSASLYSKLEVDLSLKINEDGTLRYGALFPAVILNNLSDKRTQPPPGPYFLTSSKGGGYQAALEPGDNIFTQMNSEDFSTIEIQQPFGNIVKIPNMQCYSFSGMPVQYTTACLSENNFFVRYNVGGATNDFLNEVGGRALKDVSTDETITAAADKKTGVFLIKGISPYDQYLNYIFLDTIVNKTNGTWDIYTTGATFADIDAQIVAGKSFADMLEKGPTERKIGEKSVDKVESADWRYRIFGKKDQNIALGKLSVKKHMADPKLALSARGGSDGVQTIILYPAEPGTNCYPAIVVGRNQADQTIHTVVYQRTSNPKFPGAELACNIDCSGGFDADTKLMEKSVNQGENILQGLGGGSITPGRIKIVIESGTSKQGCDKLSCPKTCLHSSNCQCKIGGRFGDKREFSDCKPVVDKSGKPVVDKSGKPIYGQLDCSHETKLKVRKANTTAYEGTKSVTNTYRLNCEDDAKGSGMHCTRQVKDICSSTVNSDGSFTYTCSNKGKKDICTKDATGKITCGPKTRTFICTEDISDEDVKEKSLTCHEVEGTGAAQTEGPDFKMKCMPSATEQNKYECWRNVLEKTAVVEYPVGVHIAILKDLYIPGGNDFSETISDETDEEKVPVEEAASETAD